MILLTLRDLAHRSVRFVVVTLLGAVVFVLFPKVVAWGVHGHGSKLGAAMYLPWAVVVVLGMLRWAWLEQQSGVRSRHALAALGGAALAGLPVPSSASR